MSGLSKQLVAWGTFGAVVLGGWALMTCTVPSKEEMLKVGKAYIKYSKLGDASSN